MTLEERLNDDLCKAEQKIQQLEKKLEGKDYNDPWCWRHIFQISEEENMSLPIPRMEIRYRVDNYNAYADYGLVIRHFGKHIDFIPFSSTRVGRDYAEKLELPFRDGAHIVFDKGNLNIPAYVTYNNNFKEIT